MIDDFTVLTESDSFLEWIGDDPAAAIRAEIERILQRQVPTAKLKWIRLSGKPEFLSGGKPVFNDETKLILIRAAMAVEFELGVKSADGEEF